MRRPPASRSFSSRDTRPRAARTQRKQTVEDVASTSAAASLPSTRSGVEQLQRGRSLDATSAAAARAGLTGARTTRQDQINSDLGWVPERQKEEAAESEEEKQRREEARRQKEEAVADALGGDFLSDWVGLSDWKAVKVVNPGRT